MEHSPLGSQPSNLSPGESDCQKQSQPAVLWTAGAIWFGLQTCLSLCYVPVMTLEGGKTGSLPSKCQPSLWPQMPLLRETSCRPCLLGGHTLFLKFLTCTLMTTLLAREQVQNSRMQLRAQGCDHLFWHLTLARKLQLAL
jgi:hypothetical protein